MQNGIVHVSGGGGYPPGGGSPPGGWGPPPGAPPGGSPPGGPPGGGYRPPGAPPPGGPGGWGPPPGGPPPGGPPPGGPFPGAPPGYGPPGGSPPGGPPPGYGPPGGSPPGGPPPGYGPPGAPPGYGPPGAPPGGGLPPGYAPPGSPPPGYVPPAGPPGGGYGPPGGPPPGGGYGPPGQQPPPGGGYGYGPPGGAPPPGWGGPPGGFVPPGAPPPGGGSGWSATDALGFGWTAVTKDFAGVALPIAVVGLIAGVLGGAPAGAFSYFLTRLAFEVVEPSFLPFISIGIRGVGQIITLIIVSFFTGGIAEFALKVARGQAVQFGDVFGGAKYFAPIMIATVCSNILVGIGAIFCLVPGLILGAGFSMATWLIVDQKLGGIDALKKSWEMTTGHKGSIIVFLLLAVLVILAGALACCLGALFVSGPMISLGAAYIYLKLKGEQPRLLAG